MKLTFVGDVSLGEHFFSFGHGPRSFFEENGFDYELPVSEALKDSDFVIANLEGPISDIGLNPKSSSSNVFRGAPQSVEFLKKNNINIVSIANNHSHQHGLKAFDDTVDRLENSGITVIGLKKRPIAILEFQGQKIGFIAASDVPEVYVADHHKKYCSFDLNWLESLVRVVRSDVDYLVLVLHWGFEETVSSSNEQKKIAQKCKEIGVDAVIGHHPHVVFEISREDDFIFAPSLGNFIFDLPWEKKMRLSGLFRITVNEGKVDDCEFLKCYLNRCGFPSFLRDNPYYIEVGGCFEYPTPALAFRFVALKKILYFFAFFWKGNVLLKMEFLQWKLNKKLLRRK